MANPIWGKIGHGSMTGLRQTGWGVFYTLVFLLVLLALMTLFKVFGIADGLRRGVYTGANKYLESIWGKVDEEQYIQANPSARPLFTNMTPAETPASSAPKPEPEPKKVEAPPAESQPEAKPEPKPEPKPEAKPEPKPEAKPEPVPDLGTETPLSFDGTNAKEVLEKVLTQIAEQVKSLEGKKDWLEIKRKNLEEVKTLLDEIQTRLNKGKDDRPVGRMITVFRAVQSALSNANMPLSAIRAENFGDKVMKAIEGDRGVKIEDIK